MMYEGGYTKFSVVDKNKCSHNDIKFLSLEVIGKFIDNRKSIRTSVGFHLA